MKATSQRIFGIGGGVVAFNSTNGIHALCQINDAAGTIGFQLSTNTATPVGLGSIEVVPLNQWTHVAFVFDAATSYIRVFVNGIMRELSISGVARPSINPSMQIASIPGDNGSTYSAFQGYMDDFQLTKGVAKYNMSFNPPLAPYPNN